MWVRLDPSKLFGSLIYPNKDNYYRVDIPEVTKNPKHQKVLMYTPGCFFVIKTKTKNLKVRYRVHYRRTSQEYYPIKWGAEVVVFAQLNGVWEILNNWHDTITTNNPKLVVGYDKMEEDQTFELSFTLRQEAELFQICLPSQGKILSIEVDSDSKIEQLYRPAKVAVLGSSIAMGSANSPAHSLPAMAYRKFGVNVVNCGVTGDHTFNCIELMKELKKSKLTLLVMDLLHINENRFLKYFKDKQFVYYVISPAAVQYERFNIKKYLKPDNIAKVTGEGHTDITHLNSSGVSYYLQQIKKKGLI